MVAARSSAAFPAPSSDTAVLALKPSKFRVMRQTGPWEEPVRHPDVRSAYGRLGELRHKPTANALESGQGVGIAEQLLSVPCGTLASDSANPAAGTERGRG